MRFNHLLSFLSVTFSFALPPTLFIFIHVPPFFPTIRPVEIVYLSLLLPAFLLPLLSNYSSPSFTFPFLFFPHFYLSTLTSLTSLLLSCTLLSALILIPACLWLGCLLCTCSTLLPLESWSSGLHGGAQLFAGSSPQEPISIPASKL